MEILIPSHQSLLRFHGHSGEEDRMVVEAVDWYTDFLAILATISFLFLIGRILSVCKRMCRKQCFTSGCMPACAVFSGFQS